MAVTFVADNEYGFNASSQSVAIPTGWTAGDLLVVAAWHQGSIPRVVTGWDTLVDQEPSNSTFGLYTRIAQTGDTSWTWTFSTSDTGCVWIGAYTGALPRSTAYEILPGGSSMIGTLGSPAVEGIFLDFGQFKRDSGGLMGVSSSAGTTRASITSSNRELIVVERTVSSYTQATPLTWTAATNPPNGTNSARVCQANLTDGPSPGERYDPYAYAAPVHSGSWVYKGHGTKNADSVGAT